MGVVCALLFFFFEASDTSMRSTKPKMRKKKGGGGWLRLSTIPRLLESRQTRQAHRKATHTTRRAFLKNTRFWHEF